MVGIVIVSHSFRIAEGVAELAREMGGADVKLETAGGLEAVVDDESGAVEHPIGTDAVRVMDAIERAWSDDGVLVLMDLGSAVLSAEMALDLLGDERRERILLCEAPLVEGAVAAAVTAKLGMSLEQVAAEARRGLAGKVTHLGAGGPSDDAGAGSADDDAVVAVLSVDLPHGLHARPAARFVQAAAGVRCRGERAQPHDRRRARRRHEPERGRDARRAGGPAGRGACVGARCAAGDRRLAGARRAGASTSRTPRRPWRPRNRRRRPAAPSPRACSPGSRRRRATPWGPVRRFHTPALEVPDVHPQRRTGRARDVRGRAARDARRPSRPSATRSPPGPARPTRASSTRTCCSCATRRCSAPARDAIAGTATPRPAPGRTRSTPSPPRGTRSTTSTCARGRSTCAAWARRCSRASWASRRPRRASRRPASWWRPTSRPPTPRGSTPRRRSAS